MLLGAGAMLALWVVWELINAPEDPYADECPTPRWEDDYPESFGGTDDD
jgi:hypothetical protein